MGDKSMPFACRALNLRGAGVAGLFAMLSLACWAQEAPAAPAPQPSSEKPLPVMDYSQPV